MRHKEMFEEGFQLVDFENSGLLVSDISDLNKTDAEPFPNDLEENTQENRRDQLKVHKNEK